MLFLHFFFQMCHALTFLLLAPTLFLLSLTLLLLLPLQLFLSLMQLLLSLTQTHVVRRRHTDKCRALLSTQTHVQIETFPRQPPSKCPQKSVIKSVIDKRKIPLHLFTIGFQQPGICADSWFLESNGKKVPWDFFLIINRAPRVQFPCLQIDTGYHQIIPPASQSL